MINHILKASMERNITISIMYLKGTEITKRNINVLEIDGQNVKAFCLLRNQRRVFKIENILSADYLRSNFKNIAK